MTIQTYNNIASDTSSPSSALPKSSTPNEQMFLQLLVAQIKNQDPTNPADGTQFVAQLAQFSQLEQTIAIRQDVDLLAKPPASQTTNPTTTA